jgi:hypothetical protein
MYITFTTRLKTHIGCSKLISRGVNNVVRPTMNKLSIMLFQVVTVEQCCNNMLTILFIVGRTTLFTPVDINLEQVVDFLNFYACTVYNTFKFPSKSWLSTNIVLAINKYSKNSARTYTSCKENLWWHKMPLQRTWHVLWLYWLLYCSEVHYIYILYKNVFHWQGFQYNLE